MLREAQLQAQLDHDNLVAIYDCGLSDGVPYIAMELLLGEPLNRLIQREGPQPHARCAWLLEQVLEGLVAIHDAGLIHRDIKPSNVMLLANGGVKLLDLGIARGPAPGTQLTSPDNLLGSPRYMSPEQIEDASSVTASADLYSAGVLLYTMLAGAPPFVGPAGEVVDGHLHHPPPPLPAAQGLEQLAQALLEKPPENRPESARAALELLRALDVQTQTRVTTVEPPGESTRLSPTRLLIPQAQPPSHKPLLVAVVALIISACGLLAALLITPKPQEPPVPVPVPTSIAPRPEVQAKPAPALGATPVPVPVPVPVPALGAHPAAPVPNTKPTTTKPIARKLRRRMRTLGLRAHDLDPQTLQAYETLRAQLTRGDPAAHETMTKLEPQLERAAQTHTQLKRGLDRLSERMKRTRLPSSKLEPLETRYFKLRQSVVPQMSRAARAQALAALLRLRMDLERAEHPWSQGRIQTHPSLRGNRAPRATHLLFQDHLVANLSRPSVVPVKRQSVWRGGRGWTDAIDLTVLLCGFSSC